MDKPGSKGRDIPAREVKSKELKRIEALEAAVAALRGEVKQLTEFVETLRGGK